MAGLGRNEGSLGGILRDLCLTDHDVLTHTVTPPEQEEVYPSCYLRSRLATVCER